jgi:hypothetical protein
MSSSAKNKVEARWEWLESKNDWHIYDEHIQNTLTAEYENENLSVKNKIFISSLLKN